MFFEKNMTTVYNNNTCFITFFSPFIRYRYILFPSVRISIYSVTLFFYRSYCIYVYLVICSCWQYGCTSQLASDKQYRLQAQLAHVVSRIDLLFYFFFFARFLCVRTSSLFFLIFTFWTITLWLCMNYVRIFWNICNLLLFCLSFSQ